MSKFGDNWDKDKLDRKNDAEFLTKYLIAKHDQTDNNINNTSFVLNVNAEWGYGKTYLLQNWVDDLIEAKHPVVYFDAWKNDFSKEPLLALISDINKQLTPFFTDTKTKRVFKNWYKTSKKLLVPSMPLLMGILAKKYLGLSLDELGDLFDEEDEDSSASQTESNVQEKETSEKSSKEVENTVGTVISKAATKMLESHTSTQKTIIEFKNNLEKLTSHIGTLESINLPIFIFIDELDRCRPDYAIEVLENIKHLFGVPGVFFVVATASEQLSHSIKAIYGQDFDGSTYLKRFFDQTYTIQNPDRYSYSEYLFSIYNLENRENLFSPLDSDQCKTNNSLIEAFAWLTSIFNCGLRDMEQFCILIDSISLTFKQEKIHIIYLLFTIILESKSSEEYKDGYKLLLRGSKPDLNSLNLKQSEANRKFVANGDDEFNFQKLIDTYFQISKRTLNVLNQDIQSHSVRFGLSYKIKYDLVDGRLLRNSSTHGEAEHFLLKYPLLIEQAGRLS